MCTFRYGLSLARLGERSSSQSTLPLIPTTARKVSRGPQYSLSWTMAQPAGPWACAPVATPRSFPEPERNRSTASGCANNPPENSTLKNRGLRHSPTRAQAPWYRKRMVHSPRLFRPLPCTSVTTRTALRYLNCHKEGAVQLGNALRAEPGGISGPHCPVGLCPREEYWENPGKD